MSIEIDDLLNGLEEVRDNASVSVASVVNVIWSAYKKEVEGRRHWAPAIPRGGKSTYRLENFVKVFMGAASDAQATVTGGTINVSGGYEDELDKALSTDEKSKAKRKFPWWRLFEFGTPGERHGGSDTFRFLPMEGKGRREEGVMVRIGGALKQKEDEEDIGGSGFAGHPGVLPRNMMTATWEKWMLTDSAGIPLLMREALDAAFKPLGGASALE